MPELEVVKVRTEDLLEYRNNAKLHPSEQVEQIVASIEEFGFNSPILAWHNDSGEPEIVAGHGRLMAARKLGLDELPVVFLDHLSEEQRRAYILVDNKLTMNSDFDIPTLDLELMDISIDMSAFGFGEEGVDGGSKTSTEKTYELASMDIKAFEHHDYIVFVFDNELDWVYILNRFNVKKLDFGYNGTRKVGLGRVIDGQRLIEEIRDKTGNPESGQEQDDNDRQADARLG